MRSQLGNMDVVLDYGSSALTVSDGVPPQSPGAIAQARVLASTEFKECGSSCRPAFWAVAGLADADGIIGGYEVEDIAQKANKPVHETKLALELLVIWKCLLAFDSPSRGPVWVIPDYDDGQAQS